MSVPVPRKLPLKYGSVFQAGKLSFFKSALYRGLLRKFFSWGSTSVSIKPSSRLCNSFSELGVLGFGLLIDGNVGIGVLPESQEIFIPLAGGGFVAHHFLRPGDLQMR